MLPAPQAVSPCRRSVLSDQRQGEPGVARCRYPRGQPRVAVVLDPGWRGARDSRWRSVAGPRAPAGAQLRLRAVGPGPLLDASLDPANSPSGFAVNQLSPVLQAGTHIAETTPSIDGHLTSDLRVPQPPFGSSVLPGTDVHVPFLAVTAPGLEGNIFSRSDQGLNDSLPSSSPLDASTFLLPSRPVFFEHAAPHPATLTTNAYDASCLSASVVSSSSHEIEN